MISTGTESLTVYAYLTQEPGDQITKDDGFICLVVGIWGRDAGGIPQIPFPFVKPPIARAGTDEQHSGSSLNEPATVDDLNSSRLHGLDGVPHSRAGRGEFLDLYRGGRSIERADHGVALTILGGGDGGLGLEHRVDAANPVGHFGGHLKQHVVADIALDGLRIVVIGHG